MCPTVLSRSNKIEEGSGETNNSLRFYTVYNCKHEIKNREKKLLNKTAI